MDLERGNVIAGYGGFIEPSDFIKNILICVLKINEGLTGVERHEGSPDVHVSVRKAPDDDSNLVLTCLATGFYPRDVQMNIRLNRNILEDQTSSGIRPNDDETFQMRISVKINRNHEGSYDCLLIHSSLTEPVSVKWDGSCFVCETELFWLYIAAAAAFLLLVLVIIGWWINRKKRSNTQREMTEENNMQTETHNHPLHIQANGNGELGNGMLLQ
ncbi:beta-2-microglobulin-like [Chanodichthys erythropterus]|uniref:beta-2-microglobulin-like n=1 Tax=Chanodichthys erythropterus TaxID=933992 RepID=UPI00351DBC89